MNIISLYSPSSSQLQTQFSLYSISFGKVFSTANTTLSFKFHFAMSIPAMVSARGETYALYQYTPSVAAAVIFLILFFCTTAMHIFQAGRRKTYYFIPLIIGGICEYKLPILHIYQANHYSAVECIGYVGRALGHSHMTNIPIYIMMTITLLVAPALFAASIYMVLGRIIVFTRSENLSPIRPSRLTKMFVCGDVLSFLIQSGGKTSSRLYLTTRS